MTKRKPTGISWESFAEHLIREAQDEGKFDNLPGFGQPIPGIDDLYDENGWLKKKMQTENLSLLPPGLQLRVDVAKELETILAKQSEEEVREATEALNQRIQRANYSVVWGPASNTMPLDVERVVAEWRNRRNSAADES